MDTNAIRGRSCSVGSCGTVKMTVQAETVQNNLNNQLEKVWFFSFNFFSQNIQVVLLLVINI